MKKIIQVKKLFAIVSEETGEILCGKWPHERFAALNSLSKRDAIRMFPNKPMAQTFLENNFNIKEEEDRIEEIGEYNDVSQDHVIKWIDECKARIEFYKTLKVVELEITTTTEIKF